MKLTMKWRERLVYRVVVEGHADLANPLRSDEHSIGYRKSFDCVIPSHKPCQHGYEYPSSIS